MKIKNLLAIAGLVLLLSGCSSLFGPDKEGWKSSQKDEFLNILKKDTYMSLCNQRALYQKVKSSKNSRLMTRLLVNYAHNLANSCIDLKSFEIAQKKKKEQEIDTYFATYQEKINVASLQKKLSAGQSIRSILEFYAPKTPQFKALIQKYTAFTMHENNVTQRQLNIIRLNIERTKLMKSEIGTHYALINIPEFRVRLIEDKNVVMNFEVVVGQSTMQTPIFSERMKYVEINPQWNVPDSIMRKEYISKIVKNPNWVKDKGYELHKESYDLRTPVVDPSSVDWSLYPEDEKGYIPYKLVQVPSKRNGLGRVKFIFPNRHAVYMHDTQMKSLFKRKRRAYSHGCIRLSKPTLLLNHITTNYSEKDMPSVQNWYDSLKTRHLQLNKSLHVHTVYFTAYVDKTGILKLYPDVYGFDKSQRLNF